MKFFTIGSGSWGLTLSKILAENRHRVRVFVRSEEKKRRLEEERIEKGIEIPPSIQFTTDISQIEEFDYALIVVPSFAFEETVSRIRHLKVPPVLIATKGIDKNLRFMNQILLEHIPGHPHAVLSGPNIAIEIAQHKPASTVIASEDEGLAGVFQEAFFTDYFRPYISRDVIGVEIGGALKNVYAIASGIVEALQLGINARASLITRALAEMMRLGEKMGADSRTFAGLAGVGDLVATSFSVNSRNHFVGYNLGKGKSLEEIQEELKKRNMVAEGINTTIYGTELARKLGVEMPIMFMVKAILKGKISVEEGIRRLIRRPLKREF